MSDFLNEWAFDAPPLQRETSESIPQRSTVLTDARFLSSRLGNG